MFANPDDPDNWFATLDVNKDGSLDQNEIDTQKFRTVVLGHRDEKPTSGDVYKEMDINNDGGVTENEYMAFVWSEAGERDSKLGFAKSDKDGNGELTPLE